MKKRITSAVCFLMAMIFMAIAVVSCGNKKPTPSPSGPDDQTTQRQYDDDLPQDLDLGGYEYRVLTYETGNISNASWNAYIEVEGYNGQLLNDAAFKRNSEVETRLHCFVTCVELGGFMETATVLKNRVYVGDDVCDVAIMQNSKISTGTLVSNGIIKDVGELSYVDLNKPYYLQSANEGFTLNGKQYFFTGDMVCSLYSQSQIWGNLDAWKARNLEDPFQLVRNGEWTFDKCFSIVKDTYSDLNGNGDHDADDFYGIVGLPTTLGYCFYSANGTLFELTDDGFEMPVTSARNLDIVDYLTKNLDNSDCYWKTDGYLNIFFAGRSLLLFSGSSIVNLHDATFETMVLPFPKYNEEQESYRSILRGALVCVPVTSINMRATGAITEAMFSASSRYMKPAYFDRFVELRVLRNPESVEMLKLIVDSGVHSFVDYFDPSEKLDGLGIITRVLEGRSNLANEWASIRKPVEKGYEEFFDNLQFQ